MSWKTLFEQSVCFSQGASWWWYAAEMDHIFPWAPPTVLLKLWPRGQTFCLGHLVLNLINCIGTLPDKKLIICIQNCGKSNLDPSTCPSIHQSVCLSIFFSPTIHLAIPFKYFMIKSVSQPFLKWITWGRFKSVHDQIWGMTTGLSWHISKQISHTSWDIQNPAWTSKN